MTTGDRWDSPMNSYVSTRCTHWACEGCWEQISRADRCCPVCHDDLEEWFASNESGSDSMSDE